MKRFLALAALVLGLASCQTEPEGLNVNVGGEVDTTITVSLPETTRANSALGAFDNVVASDNYTIRYIFQVFYEGRESGAERQVVYTDDKSVSFPVRLVPGRAYSFVAWADVVKESERGDWHYDTRDLKNITFNGDWNAMDETRDAFTDVETVVYGNTPINLELKRPFAKLRVITTDMEALNDLQIAPTKATVAYSTAHYTTFDAVQGAVKEDTKTMTKTHTEFLIADYNDNKVDKSMVLFTDYFFATEDQEVINFSLDVYDQGGNPIGETKNFTTPIPAQRNYLTTIQGNILTDGNNVNVTVDPAFDGYYTVPSEVSELVNVINSAADGVETIIPVNDNIELTEALTIPAGKNIVLDFAANKTLKGTLVVEDGAKLTVNNGTIENTDKSLSGITSNGDLTLNNVEIKSARHAVRVESGKVVIYSGTFEVDPVSASTLHALNVGDDGKSATVIIKGGTFRGPKGTMADSGSAVNVRNGSTVIIEGGNFSGGKNKTLSAAAGATLTVKGGFFDQDPSAFVAKNYTTINMNATKEYVYAVMKGSENNGSYNILIEDTAALEFFAEVVDYEYTFAGDVVTLEGDIDLEGENWNPIGDNREDNAVFAGTFDGQNHTISGAKISGDFCWDGSVYGSKEGWGLFSVLDGATVKNVKLDDEVFASYTVISGGVAGYANNTTFENIDITNTKIAGYNWYTGGVVGWAQGNCTFKDINLDSSVVVGTLWDSHGQNAGGIAGGVSSTGTYTIEDCNIACVMDVINDVTSNYKWWIYRVSGMIIGNTNTTETKYNEVVTATATNVTCKDVTVTYGDWMNYHYCEGYWNRGWGRYESSDYVGGVDQNEPHNHAAGENHLVTIPFDQLFGGSSNGSGHYPVRGLREFDGVTVNYPESFFREQGYKAEGDKYTVYSGDGFKYVATNVLNDGAKNVTVELANDIDLAGIEWPAVKTAAAFVLDGKGYAIKNLTTSAVEDHGFYSTALFTSTRKATTIKNLVVENATVTGKGGDNSHGAVLVACNYAALNIEGVTVKNSTVSNCDRSSVLVTYLYFTTATVKNCVVEGCTVNSIGTAGALLGMNNSHDFEATGNTVKNTTISSSEGSNKAGILIGTWQNAGTLTESDNTIENSKAINAGTETNNNIGRRV